MGAVLPGTGVDRARITSCTTQTKRRKVATIRGDISRTLNNAPTHYSTSPNFHCSRVIKRTNSRREVTIPSSSGLLSLELVMTLIKEFAHHLVGGRLSRFRNNREKVTQDSWVLQTVQGLRLEFFTVPTYLVIEQPKLDVERSQALSKEINKLCQREQLFQQPTLEPGLSVQFLLYPKQGRSGVQ